jgi:hypothetical protein
MFAMCLSDDRPLVALATAMGGLSRLKIESDRLRGYTEGDNCSRGRLAAAWSLFALGKEDRALYEIQLAGP